MGFEESIKHNGSYDLRKLHLNPQAPHLTIFWVLDRWLVAPPID